MLRHTIAALAVATLALIATPTAAMAEQYVPDCSATVAPSALAPGDTFKVTWHEGSFDADDAVSVSLSGSSAQNALMLSGGQSSTGSSLDATALSNGSLAVSVTLPSDALGDYSVMGNGTGGSGCGVTVSTSEVGGVMVTQPADVADAQLAATGGSAPTVMLVAGVGTVLFGIILLLTRMRSRRHLSE